MAKVGKCVVALALGLIMSLALLTSGSFAQSVNRHVASTPAHASVGRFGGGFGGFGRFGGFDDFDDFGCGCDGFDDWGW